MSFFLPDFSMAEVCIGLLLNEIRIKVTHSCNVRWHVPTHSFGSGHNVHLYPRKADLHRRLDDGKPPLHTAAENGHMETAWLGPESVGRTCGFLPFDCNMFRASFGSNKAVLKDRAKVRIGASFAYNVFLYKERCACLVLEERNSIILGDRSYVHESHQLEFFGGSSI